MFVLVPAIDLTGGRLGVYSAGGPRRHDAFGGDPLAAASAFVVAGARWLHVVDMDLAFTGEASNLEVIAAIRSTFPEVGLQISGGVRDRETVAALVDAGATRVVLGSGALADEGAVSEIVAGLPAERLLAGIEVADGRIRSRGRDPVDLDLMGTIGWLTATGIGGFLVTGVGRVGTDEGPDVATVKRVARSGVATLAAGGIGRIAHLRALRDAGVSGAVVGHAALSGSLDLVEALAWADRH
jgi:phosphoribosylformimino-5-aminoimidazole carboxamide ribotide isomerase